MKKLLFILILISSVFLFPAAQKSDIERFEPAELHSVDFFPQMAADHGVMGELFSSTGFALKACMTNAWARIDHKARSMEELVRMALDTASILDLEEGFGLYQVEEQDRRQVKLNGRTSSGILATVVLYNGQADQRDLRDDETFLSIEMRGTDSDEYRGLQKRLADVYKGYGSRPRISQVWIGELPGEMGISERRKTVREILERLDGRMVEGINSDRLISITAYSKHFSGGLKGPNGLFNFNAAIRYNSYEDKTILWLGTPIITVEY